ncbi:hypothetical protein ACSETA_10695 [Pseudomonas aeruginosa]
MAEQFIAGFEGDESQEGISDLLTSIRAAIGMRELRVQANTEAENAWRRRKGPMAAYWRAVSTYARHIAHALSNSNKTEGATMRRALTALGIIAALGLAAVLAVEVYPILHTLAAWQVGCY